VFYFINIKIKSYLMPQIELYGYGESVASNITRLALSEKKISYKYNLVYLESKGQHLRKEYRKLNPKTLIPTLVIDGKPLPDSLEIMKYIDQQYPNQGVSLFPSNDNKEFHDLVDYFLMIKKN
jgi:glutathione S-transferase